MSNYIVSIDEQSNRGKLVLQLLNEMRDNKRVRLFSVEEFDAKSDAILAKEIKNGLKTGTLSYAEGKKEFARLRHLFGK